MCLLPLLFYSHYVAVICEIRHVSCSRSYSSLFSIDFIFHQKTTSGNFTFCSAGTEVLWMWRKCIVLMSAVYTGCPRRNGQNFGRVFLMLNYTDMTQNTYTKSWKVTEIMAIEKCGLLGCLRTVRRSWRHTYVLRMPGNEIPLANIVMQWPWRDNASAAACLNYLET